MNVGGDDTDQLWTELGISTQPDSGGVLRLLLSGEVDLSNAARISDATDQALTTDHPTEILIDLAKVTFLDSVGMRTLLTAQRTAADHDVPLRVINARGAVARVLTIAGLLDVLADSQ